MGLDKNTDAPGFVSENEFISAKAFLLGASAASGGTLYEHLTKVLAKMLEERPRHPAESVEDVSKDVRKARSAEEVHGDKVDRTTEVALAEIQSELFNRKQDEMEIGTEEGADSALPDLMYLLFYFEQAGVGLNRDEMVRVQLSMKQLVDTYPLQTARFWGKIFGTEQNYYIAEVEFREGEEPEEAAEEETPEADKKDDEEEGEEEADHPPKITWKPAPQVPKEERGTGCNKLTYFVCNEPGKAWTKLPIVSPLQIQLARKIRKLFTGNLNAPITSYPPFPGNESNLLRAQLARISAATLVSPLGHFQFDEEEEEAEEGAIRESYMQNEEFAGLPLQEMIDPTLGNWVHHSLHILPQGRCSWWNPTKDEEEEEAEEEDEEGAEPKPQAEPEVGPPLLSPLSGDHTVDGTPAWTVRASSRLVPQCAIAVLSSNLWPGAHAICDKKFFENVYIGWGQKYAAQNYSPPPPEDILQEYPVGPEISETSDPTPEEEAALRAAQERAEEAGEEGEEEQQDDDD